MTLAWIARYGMQMTLAFGCCVGTWDKFRVNSETWDGPISYRVEQTSISVAFNSMLDAFVANGFDGPVALVHDDLQVLDDKLHSKVEDVLQTADLVGVVGGGPCMHWWNHEPIGHQMTDSGMIRFDGPQEGPVDIIEGSFMVFSPRAVRELRFDEQYEFLGYDDVCLHAKQLGMRVVVADIDTHHHTTVGWKSAEVKAMWDRAEVRFRQKWGNTCACS